MSDQYPDPDRVPPDFSALDRLPDPPYPDPHQRFPPDLIEPVVITARPVPPQRERIWRHVVLFVATLATTTIVGMGNWLSFQADFSLHAPPWTWPSLVIRGLWYSVTILAILGAHEAGHYLACRYYGLNASLPYFIPAPPFFLAGTFGAFIRLREPIRTKPQLFDMGAAGPFAGFVVALPALLIGLSLSRVVAVPADFEGYNLGEPLLFRAATWVIWGHVADGYSVNLHPMAFAAWFGLLVTALNLIPMGQFDGGHISYAVLGRRSIWVTRGAITFAVGLCFYSLSWVVWTALALGLLFMFGWRHPPTYDEDEPLDRTRQWLALAALVILIICFTPAPIEPLQLIKGQ